MKKKLIILSITTAFLLLITQFSTVTATKEILDEKEIKTKILDYIKEKDTNTKWYPGFMIVQLIKGVLGFIVVLMILLDLAEPGE